MGGVNQRDTKASLPKPMLSGEARLTFTDGGPRAVDAKVRVGAMMALVLVALAAFGVISLALYAVLVALKRAG